MSVVISSALVLAPSTPPLTHARIGHDSIARRGAVTASSAATGFPASAAANAMTYSYWQPESLPATWEVELETAEEIDYLGIAAHTIASSGCTVELQYHDGEVWQTAVDFVPAGDRSLMVLDTVRFSNRFRVRLTGGVPPRVGVIYIGKALAMQRPIYGGHEPATLTPDVETRPTVSERGQFLGTSVVRRGVSGSWTWRHLSAGWYRQHFEPFIRDFIRYPAFIAWRPATFPREVAYVWKGTNDLPRGQNMGIRDLMEVTLSASGRGGFEGDPGVPD